MERRQVSYLFPILSPGASLFIQYFQPALPSRDFDIPYTP